MAKTDIEIELPVTVSKFREEAAQNPLQAAKNLDPEISTFIKWMDDRGMDPLTRYEMQILKEYLGFKLTSDIS